MSDMIVFSRRHIVRDHIVSVSEVETDSARSRITAFVDVETTRGTLREAFDSVEKAEARRLDIIAQLSGVPGLSPAADEIAAEKDPDVPPAKPQSKKN